MEQNKDLIFEVMITFPELLLKSVEEFNSFYGTDFKVIEINYDEVPFCKIKVTKYQMCDVFNLGYSLAVLQYSLREKGEISW